MPDDTNKQPESKQRYKIDRGRLMLEITRELLQENKHRSRRLNVLSAQFEKEFAKELNPEPSEASGQEQQDPNAHHEEQLKTA
jgi:hypothetical protein